MVSPADHQNPRIACDAMCGGVARWLRILGLDTAYRDGIADGELVALALRERRVVVSADGKLFERNIFTRGELPGVRLPVGLPLDGQVDFVVRQLDLTPGESRCAACNGELAPIRRMEVADVVPARSLIWAREFFRCQACGHVYWVGSHWRRIRAVRTRLASLGDAAP